MQGHGQNACQPRLAVRLCFWARVNAPAGLCQRCMAGAAWRGPSSYPRQKQCWRRWRHNIRHSQPMRHRYRQLRIASAAPALGRELGYSNPAMIPTLVRPHRVRHPVCNEPVYCATTPVTTGPIANPSPDQVLTRDASTATSRGRMPGMWIGSLKHFWGHPAGAAHCMAEHGTARRALMLGAVGRPWRGGGGRNTAIAPRRGVSDTCATHTSPPRPTAWV